MTPFSRNAEGVREQRAHLRVAAKQRNRARFAALRKIMS
jgi:hypothetical protein